MDVLEGEQLTADQAFKHWYLLSKFRLLLRHIRKDTNLTAQSSAADFGCGLGVFLTLLERHRIFSPEKLCGIDSAPTTPNRSVGGNVEIFRQWPAERLVDFIIMMDVLEHVPDDVDVLREATKHLNANGWVFITVPAFPSLMSGHDHFLGHYRRYTCNSLSRVVKAAGLELKRCHYFYASIFPPAAFWRLATRGRPVSSSDLKPLPPFLNQVLYTVLRMEVSLARFNKLAGLTAVALCQKK